MKVAIIGSGFSSLSAACYLAQVGFEVDVYEKNASFGGRARKFEKNGFVFDMGPSWYWMPDVFEKFFSDFGYGVSDFYELIRLDPSYKVFWKDSQDDIPANFDELKAYFESYEPGSSERLITFLEQARIKYEVGMKDFVTKPSLSISEFIQFDTARKSVSLDLLKSISKHIRKSFSHPKLIELLEFPVLFLGAKPEKTPALYSLMNYADMVLGTWYPKGGMNEIVGGMLKVAESLGVKFHANKTVTSINIINSKAVSLTANRETVNCDIVIGGADYHHIETQLLDQEYRNYNEKYWNSRVMAPSSLLYYVGLDKKVPGLEHHNLFFDADFQQHAKEIYDTHKWPEEPLFYVCCPSKTDSTVAPENKENIFILIPCSTEIDESQDIKDKYFDSVSERIKTQLDFDIRDHVVFRKDFAKKDFIGEYNSFKGNAYGLANSLKQTAFLKPKCRNKKVKNVFYTGQLTVPGPGVPPAIVSGEVVAKLISQEHPIEIDEPLNQITV